MYFIMVVSMCMFKRAYNGSGTHRIVGVGTHMNVNATTVCFIDHNVIHMVILTKEARATEDIPLEASCSEDMFIRLL